MKELIDLPTRSHKPRENGITMVIDSGMSIRQIDDMLEVSGDYVDYVKFGWGTSVVVSNLQEKIKKFQSEGIPICFGGTLFEIAFLHNKVDDYRKRIKDYGVDLVEISDGTIDLDRDKKLDLIRDFSTTFKVLSEFGSKDPKKLYAPSYWIKSMQEELDAGAWKVIAEGRESGKSGLYRDSSEVRTGLVSDIAESINSDLILWEAPQKAQQAWFVEQFGTNVNLGNINPLSVINVETLRLGLRGDTLAMFHKQK